MSEKKQFWIILWSTEDITIDDVDLKRSIESDADAKVDILTLEDLKQMDLGKLRSLLDTFSGKSALIVSPSKELESIDFWKLGFAMGRMPFQMENKKIVTPIIAFVKGDKNSFFNEISQLCPKIVEDPIGIKREMKALMQELGISTMFDVAEFRSGKKLADKSGQI